MSEYQFYEFKSIDKPLTSEERKTISNWSSRTQASSHGATFTYHYSDFPKDELKVVEQYFDAMFYIANWGTRRLILKIPNDLIDKKKVKQYCVEGLEVYQNKSVTLIDIYLDDENNTEWIEGDGMLSSLISLRDDIIAGDYRCLYLIWLKVSTEDVINEYGIVGAESQEPEIPFGLGELNNALLEFVDVFGIDSDTIGAAIEESNPIRNTNTNKTSDIAKLPESEKDSWLMRLLEGEALLPEKFKRYIEKQNTQAVSVQASTRTVQDIVDAIYVVREERKQAHKKQQKEKHLAKLKEIENRKGELWDEVFSLIAEKNSKAYENAVKILISLKELAVFKQDFEAFKTKVEQIKSQYSNLSALKSRIDKARLLSN